MANTIAPGRWLKHNAGNEGPGNVAVLYALPELPQAGAPPGPFRIRAQAFAGVAARRESGRWTRARELRTTDRAQAWDFLGGLTRPKEPLWIFTHGGSLQADFWALWEMIECGRAVFWARPRPGDAAGRKGRRGYICSGADPFHLRFNFDGKPVRIVDVCNYARKPIEDFSAAARRRRDQAAQPESAGQLPELVAELVAGDLFLWVQRLLDSWRAEDVGTFQATAGRLAMNAYRHYVHRALRRAKEPRRRQAAGKPKEITPSRLLIHADPQVKALERAAFFGGEAQAFKVGAIEGPLYYLDVRAMYPWVATVCDMPIAARKPFGEVNPAWLASQLDCFGAIADVETWGLTNEAPCRVPIPPTGRYKPLTGRWDDLGDAPGSIVLYPVGAYRTTLCGAELVAALAAGEVRRVFNGCLYVMGRPFGDYFRHWYGKRRDHEAAGDAARAELCKMMMNSLIGKFGQRSAAWRDSPGTPSPIPWGTWHQRDAATGASQEFRSIGWHTQARQPIEEIAGSFVALPAFVTSAARWHMRQLRRALGEREIVLQDTDGLVVTQAGLDAATRRPEWSSPDMGALTLKAEIGRMHVWGPRHYVADDRIVMAGLAQGAEITGPGSYVALVHAHLGAAVRGLPPGESAARLQDFVVRPECVGRTVNVDGSTSPIIMGIFE